MSYSTEGLHFAFNVTVSELPPRECVNATLTVVYNRRCPRCVSKPASPNFAFWA